MTQTYATVREAAIAGTRAAIELARRDGWEYGGAVFPQGDRFIVSKIVTTQSADQVQLTEALGPDLVNHTFTTYEEKRKKVPAMFHVHIKNYDGSMDDERNDYFSPADLDSLIGNRNLAYLGVTDSGKVFEINAASHEEFLASVTDKALIFDLTTEEGRMSAMLYRLTKDENSPPPFRVKGTEVYAGDRQEEQKAA